MKLKITFYPNELSQFKAIGWFLLSLFLSIVLIKRFENIVNKPLIFLLFFALIIIFLYMGWGKFKYSTITIKKNYFTIGDLSLFKQKYFWKDIVSIVEIHQELSHQGVMLDSESYYVVLKIIQKKLELTSDESESKNLLIKVDTVSFEDDELEKNANEKLDLLMGLLSFLRKELGYIDIYSPEIYCLEVRGFTEKLSQLGVTCKFSR